MPRKVFLVSVLFLAVVLSLVFTLQESQPFASQAQGTVISIPSAVDVSVRTIIENSTVFPDDITVELYMAFGDLTQDGSPDLVFTKGIPSRAAVFQKSGDEWDTGTLLNGPSVTSAHRPIIAPIRNDGQNWLVYSEHSTGNTGEWLRSHRYDGTTLVENHTITSRFAWKGWFAPAAADLDDDGDLEVWFTSYEGDYQHLRRHEWDPATSSYPGVEIDVGGDRYELPKRPLAGDFLGNGGESLIWKSGGAQLELVTHTPGSGAYDHTSTPIFTPTHDIMCFDAGEYDGQPGIDIAVATWDGSSASMFLVSGRTFEPTQIASGVSEYLRTVRVGDLDGDGLAEVYAGGTDGGLYGYDESSGWRQLTSQPEITWWDSATTRWSGQAHDQVVFVGHLGGRTFRVVSLSAEGAQFSISGHVRDLEGNAMEGVTVSADTGAEGSTDASGVYTITGLITGTHTITPSKGGWTFAPETHTVSVPPDATGQDFTATPFFPQLPFTDDFSTEKGWTNDSSGDYYRDTTNEWISWHVSRSRDAKYYIPIERYSGDFRLEARLKATAWNGNAGLYFGLAEDLNGSYEDPDWPTGLFAKIVYYGGTSPPTTFLTHATYADRGRYISVPRVAYSVNQWYRVVFTVKGLNWMIEIYDDVGNPVGQVADVFPAVHSGFDYILLWSPDTGGEWPTGDGLFDDLIVEPLEAHMAPDDEFGYGLSTVNPTGSVAHELGFNWIQVYDVPTEPQPVKVLYRVKTDGNNWYDLSAFYWKIHGLAGTYGDYIDAYEIGNEVNIYEEWRQPPNASRYVDLLCTARYAIHQVDPTAKIISAGLAPVGRIAENWFGHEGHNGSVQDEREYLKEFLNANGQLCADAIGYHPMGFRADYDAEPDKDGGTPETNCSNGFCFRAVEKIQQILQQYGLGDFKIWATEVGWIVEPADECIGHLSWQGRYWQIVSAEKQAENLVGAFRYARFHWPWLEALFVFNLDFNTAPYYEECEQMNHYSIFGRPAAIALGAMSKEVWRTHLPLVLRSR